MRKIRIILGSRSDLPQLREAIRALRKQFVGSVFSIIDIDVMSIHRNPINAWTFVFTDNCKSADAIFYCGSKAFAAPGVLDAFAAAANVDIPIFGIALGETCSDAFNAAFLSIKELPGQYVIMGKDGEPYVNADGLTAAVTRFAEGIMPEPKARKSVPAEFSINIDS